MLHEKYRKTDKEVNKMITTHGSDSAVHLTGLGNANGSQVIRQNTQSVSVQKQGNTDYVQTDMFRVFYVKTDVENTHLH